MEKVRSFFRKPGATSVLAAFISILLGLVFGFILIVAFNSASAASGISRLVFTGFSSPEQLGKVLYQAAPLIMTGLSVGFAFKTGLFNIGASGQYIIGALMALIGAFVLKWPWWACMLLAMVGGAVWGIFPGLFKAFFNVNEVITSIMFNWIGLFLINVVLSNIPQTLANYYGGSVANRTANLLAANPGAIIPKAGLDTLFNSPYINISIFIAIGFAILMYVVLNKTVFGYELKACGYNRNASIYAGINAKRNIVLSMVIAGALSGVAGGIYYLSGTTQYVIEKILPSMGFNGIPVALLATSHPIGTIFSAFFIGYIQTGGDAMQPEYVKETIDMIIAAIIYLSAFSLLMKNLIGKLGKKRADASLSDGDAVPVPASGPPPAADDSGAAADPPAVNGPEEEITGEEAAEE